MKVKLKPNTCSAAWDDMKFMRATRADLGYRVARLNAAKAMAISRVINVVIASRVMY